MSNTSAGFGCFRSAFGAAVRGLSQSHVQFSARAPALTVSTVRHVWVTTHSRGLASIASQMPRSQRRQLLRSGVHSRTFNLLPGHHVFVHYVDLPPGYADGEGLPFRRTDLDEKEVHRIFGPRMDVTSANILLRILHGRRVAGTLEEPELQRMLNGMFTHVQQKKALEWLREHVYVDEVANAGLRAEDELAALGKASREQEEGQPAEGEDAKARTEEYKNVVNIYKETPNKDVYGIGILDKLRAQNKAKAEAMEKRREEERKKREEEEAKGISGVPQKFDWNNRPPPSPALQKYIDAAQSDLKEPPKMAMWERILPSAVFTMLVLGLCITYAEYYQPPEQSQRVYPDMPASVATVSVLIGLNLIVFCMWRIPPLWGLMNRYFMIVPATPKPLSLLGAMFSQQEVKHFLSNTIWLALLGVQLHEEFGRGDFLATFVGCGIAGGLGSLASIVVSNRLQASTLGMSSAWYGITAAYFWVHRYDGFKIFGIPPDPFNGVQGLGWIALLAGTNIAMMMSKTAHTIDTAGHMSGLIAGMIAGYLLEKQQERNKKLKEERNKAMLDKFEAPEEEEPAPPDWLGFGVFGYMWKSWSGR